MAYTNIDDPSAYFQTAIYTGSNSLQAITNDGNSDLKPDFLWIKQRNGTENHMLVDSTRGKSKYLLSDSTAAEQTVTSRVETFDTDGFTVNGSSNPVNALGGTYVAWQWKANGGTTVSNTDGDITTTVQANTDAGFSIVTYAGNSTNDTKIGHGLGVTLDMMLVKVRDTLGNWQIFHKDLNLASPEDYRLKLNLTDANQYVSNIWGITTRTSTTIAVKSFAETNLSGSNYVAYCFASKQGYSKFGSYVGNGSTNGTFVYTGFRPAFIMCKRIDGAGNSWDMHDSARDPFNPSGRTFYADTAGAELTGNNVDLLSNGFKQRDTSANRNGSGNTYIYMAFAENPFVTSTGIPTTAR